jgi:thiol-disulfide isomerase/thioredoxin
MLRRHLLGLCMVLVLALTGCAGQEKQAEQGVQTQPYPGNPAPDFQLQTMSGQEIKLSELRGKKVFLNFWASWCGPCRSEMPDLQEMSRRYDGKVFLLGVNMTNDDTREEAERFILELGLTFPNVLDVQGQVQKDYRVLAFPMSLTVDEQGRIVERHEGYLQKGRMEEMFQKLIAGS